jgi:hypothetical protein
MSRIPDLTFFHPGSYLFKSRYLICIKEFKYFNPKTTTKNCLYSIENIIRVVDPRSRIRLQILAIPDPNKTAVPFILFKKNKFWPVSGQDCNPWSRCGFKSRIWIRMRIRLRIRIRNRIEIRNSLKVGSGSDIEYEIKVVDPQHSKTLKINVFFCICGQS